VLAVGQDIKTEGQRAAVTRSVTVQVKPEEASKLHLASSQGKLQLAMRSQDDHEEPTPVTLSDSDLLDDGASKRNPQADYRNSLLGRLVSNLAKPGADQDDTETEPVSPAPVQQEWVVEVLSGSESYEVKFDSDRKDTTQQQGQSGSSSGASRSSGDVRTTGTSGVTKKPESTLPFSTASSGSGEPATTDDASMFSE